MTSESHGRPTLSIYSFANAICRRRLFESITPSELLRSADVGACNPIRPPANKQLDAHERTVHAGVNDQTRTNSEFTSL